MVCLRNAMVNKVVEAEEALKAAAAAHEATYRCVCCAGEASTGGAAQPAGHLAAGQAGSNST